MGNISWWKVILCTIIGLIDWLEDIRQYIYPHLTSNVNNINAVCTFVKNLFHNVPSARKEYELTILWQFSRTQHFNLQSSTIILESIKGLIIHRTGIEIVWINLFLVENFSNFFSSYHSQRKQHQSNVTAKH